MNNQQTISLAKEIENYISEYLISKYSLKLSDNEEYRTIAQSLKKLENRSKEYHNPSFVVLVVGPVKSGKSTFVNLVSGDYVSPTHFLECTIRPSIISSGKDEGITIYRSKIKEDDENPMNDILDCLNGLIEKDALPNVFTQQVPLNQDNINNYVKGGVKKDDDIILTSIVTKGGKLLQNNVFLVDMPGFDGELANFDKTYETIVKRADLIVFVQSSNSAISNVSSGFFDFMRNHNPSAPVCLIHNVFESAYWRSDEQKRKDIEEQKQYAVGAIQQKLLLEDNNAFNINLGMVNDYRNGSFESNEEKLEAEKSKFVTTEEKMYELFKKRESIRLNNCISRTDKQKSDLLEKINSIIQVRNDEMEKYDKAKKEFEKLKVEINNLQLSFDAALKVEELRKIVNYEYEEIIKHGLLKGEKGKYFKNEVRTIASNYLSKIHHKLNTYIKDKLTSLNDLKNSEKIQNHIAEIRTLAIQNKIDSTITINVNLPECNVNFDHGIDLERMVPGQFKRRTEEEVQFILQKIKDKLYGFTIEETDIYHKGFIEIEVYPDICEKVVKAKQEYENQLIAGINSEINRLKESVLCRMIPDMQKYDYDIQFLNNLSTSVKNLNIKIYE